MGKIVGIDLGTTNSLVAVMQDGKPVVISNVEGSRATPSVVAFNQAGECLVGQSAQQQAALNPQNTFYAVKRFLGRKYSELSEIDKQVNYSVRQGDTDTIKLYCPRLDKEFAPEEISAMVLRKLSNQATDYLGEPATCAVITVPAYFTDVQRQATKAAGKIAGIEVQRMINEPIAAALAYGLDQKSNETILVFDLGSSTFDVSVLEVSDGVFELLAAGRDPQLGSDDFIGSNDFARLGGLLERLRKPIEQALLDAKLRPSQIDEVVLVGGSIRMPMVQQLVREMIDRSPNQNVNPDEVVAVGAAILAGSLNC
jgi:molecular chaperone DnaK